MRVADVPDLHVSRPVWKLLQLVVLNLHAYCYQVVDLFLALSASHPCTSGVGDASFGSRYDGIFCTMSTNVVVNAIPNDFASASVGFRFSVCCIIEM
jgi:hypothetical protein